MGRCCRAGVLPDAQGRADQRHAETLVCRRGTRRANRLRLAHAAIVSPPTAGPGRCRPPRSPPQPQVELAAREPVEHRTSA